MNIPETALPMLANPADSIVHLGISAFLILIVIVGVAVSLYVRLSHKQDLKDLEHHDP